jgi:hypothetical protein
MRFGILKNPPREIKEAERSHHVPSDEFVMRSVMTALDTTELGRRIASGSFSTTNR